MIIDKNSLEINGVKFAQYLIEATINFNKLWSEDTGRSLSGDFSGTLNGIYPTFELTFRRLTQTEIELLAPIFDSATQTLKYYDPIKKAITTLQTYSGDWGMKFKHIGRAEGIKIKFISRKKRV